MTTINPSEVPSNIVFETGWFEVPIARNSDPATSQEAAEAITVSGKRASQCAQILAVIQCQPGCLPGEIAEATENPKLLTHEVGKRLSDLERRGLAVPGMPRKWAGSGKNQRSWWLPQSQGRLLEE